MMMMMFYKNVLEMRFIPERREEKFCDAQLKSLFFLFFEFFSFFLVSFVCLSSLSSPSSSSQSNTLIKNLLREKRCGLVR